MADNWQSSSDGADDDAGEPSNSSLAIEQQIWELELDAYHALLRAFSAQSNVITWSQEVVMSDVRKELRVTDEQHREVLRSLSGDARLRTIRQSRLKGKGPARSPISPSTSRKKQKADDAAAMPPPPPVLVSRVAVQAIPPPSGGRRLLTMSEIQKPRIITEADVIVPGRDASVGTPGPASSSDTLVGTPRPASGSGWNRKRARTPRVAVCEEDKRGGQTYMIEVPGDDSIAELIKRFGEIDHRSPDVREMESFRQSAKNLEESLQSALDALSDYEKAAQVNSPVHSQGLDDEGPADQNAQETGSEQLYRSKEFPGPLDGSGDEAGSEGQHLK